MFSCAAFNFLNRLTEAAQTPARVPREITKAKSSSFTNSRPLDGAIQ
jgi:hypothetical protein